MKYFIKTFGCKLNHSDSVLVEKFLNDANHEKVESINSADFVIINTCAVVNNTSDKIIKEAEKIKSFGKKIIFGGCLSMIIPEKIEAIADGIFSPTNIDDIESIIEKIKKGEKSFIIRNNNLDKATLLKDNKISSTSNIVSISEGCLGSCTYCATRLARKKLISFKLEDIICRVENIINDGNKEIHLTSQDLAVYGMDKNSQDLPALLNRINCIDREFKVKLGMMNPGWTIKIIDDILVEMESDKFYKLLHIPVQSGDDLLLEKMNRGYQVGDFLEIVNKFRSRFKNCVLATDIIVGHPLETEEMFDNTVKLIKDISPDIVHIFKFSKRPKTIDESLKDLPDRIKKDRSRVITGLFRDINEERNKTFIGKTEKVLVVEKRNDSYLCRNYSGRAVVIKNADHPIEIGNTLCVKIIDSKWNYLEGKA